MFDSQFIIKIQVLNEKKSIFLLKNKVKYLLYMRANEMILKTIYSLAF